MRRIFLFLSIYLLAVLPVQAVEGISQAFVFYQPSGSGADSAFLEVAWQLNPASVAYQQNGGILESQLLVQTSITGPQAFLLQDAFVAATTPFEKNAAMVPPIYFRQRYRLPDSGKYFVILRISEKDHPERFVELQDSVEVILTENSRFSSLMILDTMYQPAAPNPYVKAGMERIARPMAFADKNQLDLNFYTELYHAPAKEAILQLSVSRKQNGGPLPGLLRTDTLRQNPKLYPIAGHFDLKELSSGNYYLNAVLFDSSGKPLASRQLFFQLSNPFPATSLDNGWDTTAFSTPLKFLDISKTFVGKYSDEERRAILKMIRPVADEVETANINIMLQKGSDPLHTAYFIYNFFQKRNKEKPEQEWKTYASKVREANKRFPEAGRMGYESDRGKVYLQYGMPDERLRVPSETGALPYEVWRYNYHPGIPAPSYFLFYQDGFAIGELRLLHSNVPGEIYNARWGEILFKGDSERLKNSRAWRLMNNE